MKKLLLLVCLLAPVAIVAPGCSTAPSARVVEVQTIKSVGQAAEAAVALSAHLYADKVIDAAQARTVIDLYNGHFQPAYRLAVAAAHADLSTVASPDLADLAAQVINLVASYQKH
jgi:hypothetical protein